ncbi:TIM-barrel domain-containing protein [Bacteroides sp. OM05-12]|jgi:alpha-D-xyloside xylohydrolase|uniref:glycoside hydrolase family 31 protein n=1 Tax=Bacteroides sp. OM05-12 TaxID=2292283 RepID=UPI000E992875|nr:TIM-barrel domain-containing protein [Bacteroides sp. OM05-12]RGN50872.1 glycoside hydrolase family 31 protein [Bacteroides sp. OM05-12]
MKQTNYHLFDFLDFDTELKTDEALWKACKPTAIYEKDGDICVTVPFQKQQLANDMAADETVPRQESTFIIRYYTHNILRLFAGFGEAEMTDRSEMLRLAPDIRKKPLTVREDKGEWSVYDAEGRRRALINLREPVLDYWSDLLPVPQETLDITFYPDDKKEIRLSAYDHFSPPRYDALPLAYCVKEGHKERATISFECQPDEVFAGTGERFYKMDLSGHTFQLKNQDGQGVNNRRAYKNIPFYLSSRMYGVFYHTSAHSKLSLADHSTRSVQFLSDQAMLDVFLIGGNTPEEILCGYRSLTGFPSMPPLWSFGTWMSRMTYFSADEVTAICNRLRAEQYPCDVIHLDTGWFKTDWLCEWKFNDERFPDPKGFIHQLKDNGFRVSLWQLPYVAEDAEQIDEARENNYIGPLTKKQDSEGSNFSALDYAGTIDFTYPKAVEWYKGLLKNLLDMGVTCIKADFGENIHMDAEYHGMSPELLNNLYALLYQKAAYEITKEVTGDGIIWARAAWAGCQRYPLHWGGDSASTWDGMAGSLKGGIHFGLSGFAFWSHDVPGFHSLPNFMNSPVTDDLYVRWTQFGVFSSHIRYHGTSKREPWSYPAIAPIVKKWWNLRYALIPYIIEQSEKATRTGYPVLRALIFHHPEDKLCWHIDDEYYFGDDFLVAPVMNGDNRRDVYLPEGRWVNFFTGERLEGGRWLKNLEVPLDEMPVYVREGAEIPYYPEQVQCTDEMDLNKQVSLRIDNDFKGIWTK